MTNKENALIALHGGKPESVPCFWSSCQVVISTPMAETPPLIVPAGLDGYGVHQTATASAGGMFTPTTSVPPVLTDILKWKEQVHFPDYEQVDWEAASAFDKQMLHLMPELFVQDLFSANGLFERLHFLMGFEEAMYAINDEPEAVAELVHAIADKKIEFISYAARYYQPDVFTYLDDYAHIRGQFISMDTFRSIFKPEITRIARAAKENGMIFKMHCCGKMDVFTQDFIEIGADAIDPIQPVNDFVHMKALCGDKVGLVGGLDIQGIVDRVGATEEELRSEVRRCIDTYAKDGGYMVYGASVNMFNPNNFAPDGLIGILIDECGRYGSKA